MKQTKKVMSLLLTLIVALTMSMPAFAGENNASEGAGDTQTFTITAPNDDRGYDVYQIFTGDLHEGVLSNIAWGQNGTGSQGAAVDQATLDNLVAVNSKSDSEKASEIQKYVNFGANAFGTVSSGSDLSNVPAGYYLIKDKGHKDGSSLGEGEAYSLFIVQVAGNVTITPKVGVPSVDKKIVEGGNKVATNEASIGDTVNYEITGTLPSRFDDYKEYFYTFTDTLSKGLTLDSDSIAVTVNGVDVTKYFYKNASEYDETNGTTLTVGIQDIKVLNNIEAVTVNTDSKVVLTYSATLNEHAVVGGTAGNPNDVKLSCSNDPNNSGTGTPGNPPENPGKPEPTHPAGDTPKSEVTTFTTSLTILKTTDKNVTLPGVEFTLAGDGVNIALVTTEKFAAADNGEYWKLKNGTYTTTAPTTADDETDNSADYDSTTQKYSKTTEVTPKGAGKTETNVVGVIDDGGHVTFSGLGAGDYTLTETVTPAGYNSISPISFTISFNAADKSFSSDNDAIALDGGLNTFNTTIINKQGSLLPSTGGMGTTIFYVVGGILVAGAAVLLVVKRRMKTVK